MTPTAKLEEATIILQALGLPPAQTNDRSALTLLALAGLTPEEPWTSTRNPLLRTVDIIGFVNKHYGRDYAPNSRETFRRQTLHQFEQARLVDRNRDDQSRATNSGLNNYSLTSEMLEILRTFPTPAWRELLRVFVANHGTLDGRYRRERQLVMVPVILPDGSAVSLSAGKHNELQAAVLRDFCPRFISSGVLLYLGDTADKTKVLAVEELADLNIPANSHDKLPDIVVLDRVHDWLFLVEAVTSHGPVSPKRHEELEKLFSKCLVGRVYVTAFPDKATFRTHVAEIAWETEVWIADNPDHMIHFDGQRFMGPYESI